MRVKKPASAGPFILNIDRPGFFEEMMLQNAEIASYGRPMVSEYVASRFENPGRCMVP